MAAGPHLASDCVLIIIALSGEDRKQEGTRDLMRKHAEADNLKTIQADTLPWSDGRAQAGSES